MGPHLVRSFSRGAAATLGSTVIGCILALPVEASAHRLLFRLAPHKYANVKQAYGLTEEQLQSVRHLKRGGSVMTPLPGRKPRPQ